MSFVGHFSGAVFDRADNTLYIFDAIGKGREKRVSGASQAWNDFLHWIGIPMTFTTLALPSFKQVDASSCSFLAVHWVVQTLRSFTGLTKDQIIHEAISRQQVEPHQQPQVSEAIVRPLRFMDWPGGKFTGRKDAMRVVRGWTVAFAASYLNLRSQDEAATSDKDKAWTDNVRNNKFEWEGPFPSRLTKPHPVR